MGLEDKKYLHETYGKTMGKAMVNGYCIKFKMLKDINIDTLERAIRDGVEQTKNNEPLTSVIVSETPEI